MKKSILLLAFTATLAFTSCNKDDDGNGKKCATCNIAGITTEACDNGDGTVTVTTAGVSETLTSEELDGLSPAEYVEVIKLCPDIDIDFGL